MIQVSQTIKNIAIAILLLIIVFFLGRCTAPQSTQDKGGVLSSTSETKTDTTFITLPPLIVHDTIKVPTLKKIYLTGKPIPTIQLDGSLTLSHRVYSDTVELKKNLKVGYTAHVSGVLDTIELGIRDNRPTMVIHDSTKVTNTLTIKKYPTGLYIGAFANQQFSNFGPEVQLVRPKFSLGVGYDLKQASPQFRVGLNLLRDKH